MCGQRWKRHGGKANKATPATGHLPFIPFIPFIPLREPIQCGFIYTPHLPGSDAMQGRVYLIFTL
jgi:hypothetical protein